jgi:hypothetical protein
MSVYNLQTLDPKILENLAKSRDLTLGLRAYVRVLELHGSYLR